MIRNPNRLPRPGAQVPAQLTLPTVQTILFQGFSAGQAGQAFHEPVQTVLAEGFPCVFNLVVLSAITGAPRGMLGCTHLLEVDDQVALEHQHNPTPITYQGTGICFRLEITQLQVAQPCVLTVKTTLSTGTKGTDVPLWIVDAGRLRGSGLALKG